MKFVHEYRNANYINKLCELIKQEVKRPWIIMEICGGQTHAILKYGLEKLIPSEIRLVHGPGCPVCVTSLELIDKAMHLALRPNVIFCSFGDMLRVPGSYTDLLTVKSEGGDVRIVYSPLDALNIAKKNPTKEVVFFAIGFETTAPANAMAILRAHQLGIKNFSALVSHVLVPQAMEAILSSKQNVVQGFLAAGHVCTVMGYQQYIPFASKYQVPIVITGFEPIDILHGIYLCIKQLERGESKVENQYSRVVTFSGNLHAQELINKVMEITDRKWRGIGKIANSGLKLREQYRFLDAQERFELKNYSIEESKECIAGLVLQGIKKPSQCPAFKYKCTPEKPLGATMVSQEGACAAYYQYQ